MAISLKQHKHTSARVRARLRRQARGRKNLAGTAERPRLVITRSAKHISAQVVDDSVGKTLAYASTMEGELSLVVKSPIEAKLEDGQVVVTRPDDERASRSLHGLSRTLIANLIIGVTEGYSKSLEVVGTGYRVQSKGQGVEFALGFSHSITVDPPAGISFEVEGNNKLTVKGIDKQAVGEVAANIRKLRKPEPYKGKGVRYAGEVVRRKAGKSGK